MEEPREVRIVLLVADISGYTKFMVENQRAAVHGQVAITLLIETLLSEVDIPLTLHGIEGDAVFLSAAHPGSEEGWHDVLAQVRTKLPRFFAAFLAGIVRAAEITPCDCPSCRNVDQLKLKIVVHSGRAVLHTIAGLPQVSGTDVIVVHRLLKNSVGSDEYLLMTDAAYRDVGRDMGLEFRRGEEQCEGIGAVQTWVHLMGDDREQVRDELYAESDAELRAETRRHLRRMTPAMWRAAFTQLRHPTAAVSWPRRAGYLLRLLAETILMPVPMLLVMRRRVLGRRAARVAGTASR